MRWGFGNHGGIRRGHGREGGFDWHRLVVGLYVVERRLLGVDRRFVFGFHVVQWIGFVDRDWVVQRLGLVERHRVVQRLRFVERHRVVQRLGLVERDRVVQRLRFVERVG